MEAQPPKQRRRPIFLSDASDRHLPPFRTWRCLCVNVFIFRYTCEPKATTTTPLQTHTPYTPFPAAAAPAPPPAPAPPATPVGIVGIAMSSRVSSPAVCLVGCYGVRRGAIDASGPSGLFFLPSLYFPYPPVYAYIILYIYILYIYYIYYIYIYLYRIAPFSFTRSASTDKSRPASRSPSCLATSCLFVCFLIEMKWSLRVGVKVWVWVYRIKTESN